MERKTAEDFDPELLILFDAYVHGDIDRRGFLDRATKFAVGTMTAGMAPHGQVGHEAPNIGRVEDVPVDWALT